MKVAKDQRWVFIDKKLGKSFITDIIGPTVMYMKGIITKIMKENCEPGYSVGDIKEWMIRNNASTKSVECRSDKWEMMMGQEKEI